MLSPSPVPDNDGEPSGTQWQQWGTWVLFVIAGIVIVLTFIGVAKGLFY